MPWRPLPKLAYAICRYPFTAKTRADLSLQIGDEVYIFEKDEGPGDWCRGYLMIPPSLLAGLTSTTGQVLEKRVFTGVFPLACVKILEEIRIVLPYLDSVAQETANGDESISPPEDAHNEGDADGGLESQKRSEARDEHRLSLTRARYSFADGNHLPEKPLAPMPMLKIGDDTASGREEPLVDEIASCLREWHATNLHQILLDSDYLKLGDLSFLASRLDYARRQLLHNILTNKELQIVHECAIWDLVQGNKMLSRDVIVRTPSSKGRLLTSEDSAIELSRLQLEMSLLDEPPVAIADSKSLRHVCVDLKSLLLASDQSTKVSLCLYRKLGDEKATLLCEPFGVDLSSVSPGVVANFAGVGKTLFSDLDIQEPNETLSESTRVFLVLRYVALSQPASTAYSAQPPPTTSASHSNHLHASSNATWRQPSMKAGRKSMMWASQKRRESSSALKSFHQRPDTGKTHISEPHNRPRTAERELAKVEKPIKRLSSLAVVDITSHIHDLHDHESIVDIRSLSSSNFNSSEPTAEWSEIAKDIAPGAASSGRLGAVTGEAKVGLKAFKHSSSIELVQNTPTLLHETPITRRIGFAGTAPVLPRSDIYLTLMRPNLPDNAFLAHPRFGSAPMSHDIGMANLQLTLEVRNASGDRISNCIFPSSNSGGHTAWRTAAIDREDSWNHTLRLAVSPEDVPGSHVVMSLADGFRFPFALCWMPLWTQGAFMRNKDHSLALYKYDEATSSLSAGKGAYLSLPWSSKSKDEAVTGALASVHLNTFLCSTMYSQDPDLLALLKWRDRPSQEVITLLKRFTFVPELEIVKLFSEVLDSLFEILVEYAGNDELEDLVFSAIVIVLGIVHDRRFNLQPLVDDYTRTKFRWPFAFPGLIRGFLRLLQDPANPDVSRKLRALSKVGNHVLKFIITARQQQIAKEVGIGIKSHPPTFSKDLASIFNALTDLMTNSSPTLIGTKTLIVQNYHQLIPELKDVLTPLELLETAVRFVDSCSEVQGKLILYKLLLIRNLSASSLASMKDTQKQWQEQVQRWLDPHWGNCIPPTPQYRDQVRLCCSSVATLVEIRGTMSSLWLAKLVDSYLELRKSSRTPGTTFTLLFPTSYPFTSKSTVSSGQFDEGLIEIFALLATSFSQDTVEYPSMSSREQSAFLGKLIDTCQSILNLEAFPRTWLSIHIYHHKTILKILESMFETLISGHLPPPDDATEFNTELWKAYLSCLLKLVSSEALTLESFPEQKRRAVWKIAGDVREIGASLLRRTWQALGWDAAPEDVEKYGLSKMGGYQVPYVPGFVGPILELCLSVHDGLRQVSTEVLYSMIMSEWALSQDLNIIQAEMIEALDRLYKEKPLRDGIPHKDFLVELLERFESIDHREDELLSEAVTELLSAIDELLELLAAVYASETADDAIQILDTLRLLEYLKDMQKDDIYIGYVHKLARVQAEAGNGTEAGLALKLHAELYSWNASTIVPAIKEPAFPSQTTFERRERIYLLMIKHLEDGQAWHSVLDAYSELAQQYQNNVFDFSKLARAQRAMATVYEKIARGEIEKPRYFRVHYRGLGFPASLMNKQFIFEGLSSDRLSSFTDRLREQYPSAHIGAPSDDLEGQYLSIHPVSLQKNFLHPVNRKAKSSHTVKEYFMHANPRTFSHSSRRQASNAGVKDQAQDKVIYTTADAFPTILRRSEIINVETVRLTPIQIGLERTSRKTQDLRALAETFQENGESALQPLTDYLMVLVNRSSSGSVAEYWQLVDQSSEPEDGKTSNGTRDDAPPDIDREPLTEALRIALIDHVLMIQRYLNLYTRSAHQAVRNELTKDLEKTFSPVLEAIKEAFPPPSNEPPTIVHNRAPSAPRNQQPQHQANGSVVPSIAATAGAQEPRPNGESLDVSTLSRPSGTTSSASRHERAPSRLSQLKEFGKLNSASHRLSTTVSVSGDNDQAVLAKGAGLQSLQARVGSVTKRLSALNVGSRGSRREKDRKPSDDSRLGEE